MWWELDYADCFISYVRLTLVTWVSLVVPWKVVNEGHLHYSALHPRCGNYRRAWTGAAVLALRLQLALRNMHWTPREAEAALVTVKRKTHRPALMGELSPVWGGCVLSPARSAVTPPRRQINHGQ